ncbi:hypothetical protein ACFWGL_22850 [Streptomyces sp. NPDC060286]|uniref:hypothetical protein n=1 Tax=unclassified Streptomyces TaxID=2593676 RepID=UPI0035DF7444
MASRTVGLPQIRHRGIVGGCMDSASPEGDAYPPLLAADAVVEAAWSGESAGLRPSTSGSCPRTGPDGDRIRPWSAARSSGLGPGRMPHTGGARDCAVQSARWGAAPAATRARLGDRPPCARGMSASGSCPPTPSGRPGDLTDRTSGCTSPIASCEASIPAETRQDSVRPEDSPPHLVSHISHRRERTGARERL